MTTPSSRPSSAPRTERSFSFEPTPAVAASRSHSLYVGCSSCGADSSRYLFHHVGIRFVRCRVCGLVYVNPVSAERVNYFDIERVEPARTTAERDVAAQCFEQCLERIARDYERVEGKPLERTLLIGRWLDAFQSSALAQRCGLQIARADDRAFQALAREGDLQWVQAELAAKPQVVILSELLEATRQAGPLIEALAKSLAPDTWIVVTYQDAASLPARMATRLWPQFFSYKSSFFDTSNLSALMGRFGLGMCTQFAYPSQRTAGQVLQRIAPNATWSRVLAATPLAAAVAPVPVGHRVAAFRPQLAPAQEKLSIVFPVFNEARYVAHVIEAILAKPLKIPKELIIVESNSTDGTREVVQTFEGREGVRVIYEDAPRGKGHAVKTGLCAVTGSIILIQDADFEYDIDDYDALLEPILQRRTAFVLGSRSLGLDDWKVRRYANNAFKGFLLNAAQVGFAKTFNFLYQQHITDVNTMFKVFRTECLNGVELECERFNLDIELACKLVKGGNSPLEVPVNYVSRGFDEGKKISFVRDALPSYWAFFRYRFK